MLVPLRSRERREPAGYIASSSTRCLDAYCEVDVNSQGDPHQRHLFTQVDTQSSILYSLLLSSDRDRCIGTQNPGVTLFRMPSVYFISASKDKSPHGRRSIGMTRRRRQRMTNKEKHKSTDLSSSLVYFVFIIFFCWLAFTVVTVLRSSRYTRGRRGGQIKRKAKKKVISSKVV